MRMENHSCFIWKVGTREEQSGGRKEKKGQCGGDKEAKTKARISQHNTKHKLSIRWV